MAFHAEYVQKKDLVDKHNKDERQLKWDSCGIWSIGPIAAIRLQCPAKRCLAAAIWPQRDDDKGTDMGLVPRSYKRVTPAGVGQMAALDAEDLRDMQALAS